MSDVLDWLIAGEPWTEYRTRIELMGQAVSECTVIEAKRKVTEHPLVKQVINDLEGWSDDVITNHKKAGMWLHKLSFLAEIGLEAGGDDTLDCVCNQVLSNTAHNGVLKVMINVPKVFGGSGENVLGWALCDAPLAMYSLAKMGFGEQLEDGAKYLVELGKENGWQCACSPELGKFRGPGKKEDTCPYATLLMLKLISQYNGLKDSEQARNGADSLLNLWENSRQQRPYLFKMGTDFRKLKAPFVWYDILHVADVLSQFDWIQSDKRYNEMIDIIEAKANDEGLFTPESVWMAWKGFDFAQKKSPSSWITFLVHRILSRNKSS